MANYLRLLAKVDELDRAEALEYPVVVAGDIIAEKNAVAVFESDDEFLHWAKQTKHADTIQEVHRLASESAGITAYDRHDQQRVSQLTHNTIKNIEQLSVRNGIPTWSEELFAKAIEEKILHSSLIYRHTNLGGDFRPIVTGTPVPFFSWIGFNDTASSALVSGSLLLCARTLFRGKRLWLFGAPATKWNLTDFDFNDRASSGVAFG